MPIDIRRVALAAIEAALEDPSPAPPKKRPRLSGGRAVLLGAGLMTAGRLVAGGRARGIVDSLQQRLDEARGEDDDELDDEYDDELDDEDVEAESDEDLDDGSLEEDDDYVEAPRSTSRGRVRA